GGERSRLCRRELWLERAASRDHGRRALLAGGEAVRHGRGLLDRGPAALGAPPVEPPFPGGCLVPLSGISGGRAPGRGALAVVSLILRGFRCHRLLPSPRRSPPSMPIPLRC